MKVTDIKCFCEGTDTGSFLKEDEYSEVLSNLAVLSPDLDKQKETVIDETNSGGLSASALNLGGFSPLFEMAYVSNNNISSAINSLSEIETIIKNDANTHMINEWGKYYQEVQKCTEKKKKAKEEAYKTYSNLKSDDPKYESAQSTYLAAEADYQKHVKELENASSTYELYAGEGEASKALNLDFDNNTTSITTGGNTQAKDLYDLGNRANNGDTEAQKEWIEKISAIIDPYCKKYGFPKSVLIAQIIQESGWIKSGSWLNDNNNILNVNSEMFGSGDYVLAKDGTRNDDASIPRWAANPKHASGSVSGGAYFESPRVDSMRAYDCIEDCVEDYLALMVGYRPYLNGSNVDKCIDGIKGYAEDASYASNLHSAINKYNLTQYDTTAKGSTGATSISNYKNLSNMNDINNKKTQAAKVREFDTTITVETNSTTKTATAPTETANKAVQWATNIASDNSYGYVSGGMGAENGGYDCTQFVHAAYRNAGVDIPDYYNINNANIKDKYEQYGFTWHEGPINPSDLQAGDVLVNHAHHAELYIGNGQKVGAHDDFSGGSGDPSGNEISVDNYTEFSNGGWDGYLRYNGNK